ncbi:hypothetical protein F5B22DRAFT_637580 [Xylaria bambusicola]|uniref:uncharacterized protein n=1 Tax=Xylaria bambusicola TaxID=326684 RepID=UPI002008B72E|nr:uncharacterized protein F5B22DRAFT_637580 [Xylaria bambusicola]KAI0512771.1 hypothetical protein F5B22DRAFT_637580 [Xylaria bambusicola]
MEQPETPDDTLRSVQPPRPPPASSISPQSTPRLANSEPNPDPPIIEDLSDSVLSLRFPRPLGNRQLTNWISSSSPDIMQPGNVLEEDPNLAELGYDIIGTDGESQAESVASSFDYQKSDGIHSLTGTDVDTDSSDDEETHMNETTISDATVIDRPQDDEAAEAAEAETLALVDQSLENPTSLSLTNFPPLTSSSHLDRIDTHKPTGIQSSAVDSQCLSGPEILPEPSIEKESENADPSSSKATKGRRIPYSTLSNIQKKWRMMVMVCSLAMIYSLALVTKSVFLASGPRELSTVPVASVSVIVPLTSTKSTHSLSTSTSIVSQTHASLPTASSPNSLVFNPFSKDNGQADVDAVPVLPPICSAELSGRDEIIIRIPPTIKSDWLAKDAILIAVSRGLEDIPTKVSSIDAGFAIQVPLKDAHGVLSVTIVTTRKPFVNESFRLNFGSHRFTEAVHAGKQLVRDFAQRVVDTVNGTTSWVEETYIPAFDAMSKQVCDQTVSVSGSLLHGLQELGDAFMSIPRQLIAQMQNALDMQSLRRRAIQIQLELRREVEDIGDELRMAMLTSRINSKLMWLALRGKVEEHGAYLNKAELHCKEQRARVDSARVERAQRTKNKIQAWRERDGPVSKESFWHTMGAWAGFEER